MLNVANISPLKSPIYSISQEDLNSLFLTSQLSNSPVPWTLLRLILTKALITFSGTNVLRADLNGTLQSMSSGAKFNSIGTSATDSFPKLCASSLSCSGQRNRATFNSVGIGGYNNGHLKYSTSGFWLKKLKVFEQSNIN